MKPIYVHISDKSPNVPARTVSWPRDPFYQALPPVRQLWSSAYYDDADDDDADDADADDDDGDDEGQVEYV